MIDGRRVVVVIPAGRRRYLELLMPQLMTYVPFVDEIRLWLNTLVPEDIEYIKSLPALHGPHIVTVHEDVHGDPRRGNLNIHRFFARCQDPRTVYVRFDDDIVLVDKVESFVDFVRFRIAHPEYFLLYATIINNAVVTHILQSRGALDPALPRVDYACLCRVGWRDPGFAVALHRSVLHTLDNDVANLSKFYNKKDVLYVFRDYERVSINCISWLGEEFAAFNGAVGTDEEQWLACDKPRSLQKPNCMYGGYVVVHYAFHTQRDQVDRQSDVLASYKSIASVHP